MKQIRLKWKYVLASLLLANIIACSNDDFPDVDNRRVQDDGARTAAMVSETITLTEAGTLETKVSDAMGDKAVATLQELVVFGPFTSTDMQYVRDSLTGLKVLNMEGVQLKASDEPYYNYNYFQDNQLCNEMFYQMDNLKEVVLPSTITSIGEFAFAECDSLVNVVIPDNVTAIEYSAFSGCDTLTTITLPSKLTTLGSSAFSYCESLTSVVVPDSVKTIQDYVFENCYSLVDVKLPENLVGIGNGAFEYCYALESIQIPESVETIGNYAFYSCSNLKELTIPANVTNVGYDFVSNCNKLHCLNWKTALADVPDGWGVDNCILFVESDQIAVNNWDMWKAIVINGYAESTIKFDSNNSFANYKEFKAKKLSYERYFSGETVPGYSTGWQTIVLPFTPDSIYHETKGQIAPFGSELIAEGAKPFWLRELTSEGFVDVTTIEPNKPYIIAMPNHNDYLDEYRLDGTITFVAKDSVLRVTPEVLDASVGPDFEFHPTYSYVDVSSDVYALTSIWDYYEEDNAYYSKSFFRKDYSSVSAFNAYVTTLGGGRSSRSMFDLDTRSKETRAAWIPNKTGIPQIGDM